ncbi:MAG: hypothetical protein VX899_16325 [Myxococcota bacterium]|nr:hypothetical protein [Myxococcota bacterium]
MIPLLLSTLALAGPSVEAPAKNASLETGGVLQAIRPGVHVAVDSDLLVSPRDRLFTDEELIRTLSGSVGVMGWWHPRNQTPLFVQGELSLRRTGTWLGFQKELSVGLGLGYAINGGWTYRYSDSGELWGTPVGGRPFIAPSVGIGLGQDLSQVKPKVQVTWYTRARMHYQWPYNVAGAPVFTAEAGIRRPIQLPRSRK